MALTLNQTRPFAALRRSTVQFAVFDAIVESAVRLCEARFGAIFRLDNGLLHLVAHHNFHAHPMVSVG